MVVSETCGGSASHTAVGRKSTSLETLRANAPPWVRTPRSPARSICADFCRAIDSATKGVMMRCEGVCLHVLHIAELCAWHELAVLPGLSTSPSAASGMCGVCMHAGITLFDRSMCFW